MFEGSAHMFMNTALANRATLEMVGERFCQLAPELRGVESLGFIAVNPNGAIIAAELANAARTMGFCNNLTITGVDPYRSLRFPESWLDPLADASCVIVDTDIVTGETARRMLDVLASRAIRPSMYVKPIEYQDQLEVETLSSLRADYPNVDFISLFTPEKVQEQFQKPNFLWGW
jgi:hypothetical protein